MEGICGLISFDGTLENPSQMINEMANALSDGESLGVSKVTGNNWALACTNWIESSWRPITFTHQDSNLAVVGIADIQNLPDLANQYHVSMEKIGEVFTKIFRSNPKKWALQFRGNFAVIILDTKNHRLIAATDRIGIRPVYWHERGNIYYLSSRINGIRCVCPVLDIDDGAIYAYIHHSMIPSPLHHLQKCPETRTRLPFRG